MIVNFATRAFDSFLSASLSTILHGIVATCGEHVPLPDSITNEALLTCPALVGVAAKHVAPHPNYRQCRAFVVAGGVEGRCAVAVFRSGKTLPPTFAADFHGAQVTGKGVDVAGVAIQDFRPSPVLICGKYRQHKHSQTL